MIVSGCWFELNLNFITRVGFWLIFYLLMNMMLECPLCWFFTETLATWAHSTLGNRMRFSYNVDGCIQTFLKLKQLAQLYTIIIELRYPYSTATTHDSKFRCWCHIWIDVEMPNNAGLVHADYCRKKTQNLLILRCIYHVIVLSYHSCSGYWSQSQPKTILYDTPQTSWAWSTQLQLPVLQALFWQFY